MTELRVSSHPARVADMPTHKDAQYYKMDSPKRGIALIFSHEHFISNDGDMMLGRTGTKVDCENLENCLSPLGFDIQIRHDLTYDEIKQEISKVSSLDHSDSDCILIVVLSHGEDQGLLHAKDGPYKSAFIWESFTPDKCPTLAGKPKLFILQACRGSKVDHGVTLHMKLDAEIEHETTHGESEVLVESMKEESTETSNTYANIVSYTLPQQADFLIVYPVIDGHYCFRNTKNGSWLIQALCKEVNLRGHTEDFLSILTYVNQNVAVDFETRTPANPETHQKKQAICIQSTLIRDIKFNRKIHNANVS